MEAYRYQELAYLVIPALLGVEFVRTASAERAPRGAMTLGAHALNVLGLIFMIIVPLLFAATIWGVQSGPPHLSHTFARLDRYVVMFMFLGGWWQIYMICALRAKRLGQYRRPLFVLGPLVGLGLFISLLVLWVSPFGLKWISMGWFLVLASLLYALRVRSRTMEKVFWGLTAVTFFFMNLFFIFLDSVV